MLLRQIYVFFVLLLFSVLMAFIGPFTNGFDNSLFALYEHAEKVSKKAKRGQVNEGKTDNLQHQ